MIDSEYVSKAESEIASISYETVREILGSAVSIVLYRNEICACLKQVNILRQLPLKQLEVLASGVVIQHFAPLEEIVTQDAEDSRLFIIKSGKVNVMICGQVVRAIGANDYFGERSVLFGEKRSASVFAVTEVDCYILDKQFFLEVVNESVLRLLHRRVLYQDHNVCLLYTSDAADE